MEYLIPEETQAEGLAPVEQGSGSQTGTRRPPAVGRRQLFQIAGGVTTAAVAENALGWPPFPRWTGAAVQPALSSEEGRRERAYRIRHEAALYQYDLPGAEHPTNGDEERYPNRIASYSKHLPHDERGEVDPTAYEALLRAVRSGDLADFRAVPRGGANLPIGFVTAFAFVLEGTDPQQFTTIPPPALASEELAGEMAEVYWQALTRDVPFSQYGEDRLTQAASDELRRFSGFGDVAPENLFRGHAPGERDGPYISQFLWKDIPFGAQRIVQTCRVPLPGVDHMTDYAAWLGRQNGQPPVTSVPIDPTPRYIRNGRDLSQWVRDDFVGQCGWNAVLIVSTLGPDARDRGLPETVGPIDLLGRVGSAAIKAGMYQKWGVHRSLRPEEYGGRVHNHVTGVASYPLHPKILGAQALDLVYSRYGTYLLPMAYPMGCPPFSSYPANHAATAGAAITVLKAVFDEGFPIPDPVVATDDGLALVPYDGPTLTLGGELNKLAANVAYGRDLAGIHFRSDGVAGLKLGEDVAISILRDLRPTLGVPFSGFTLTKFDGATITV